MDGKNNKHMLTEANTVLKRGKVLAESKYGKFCNPVLEYMDKKGRRVSDNMEAAMGFCCENFAQEFQAKLKMTPFLEAADGATTSNDIKFVNWAFQLMSALLPNLIADQIFSVQPMDRRQAQIFYLDIEASSNKGAVKIGDKLASVESGFNADYSYPLQYVKDEEIETGDAGDAYTGSLAYVPVIESTIIVTATATDGSTLTVEDNGAGGWTGDVTAGTMNYTNGAWAIQFNKNVENLSSIVATYEYRMDLMPENTPKIKLSIQDKFIRAIYATLGAIWVLHAGYDLQKAHGVSARDVLMETQGGLLRRAIDHYLLELVRRKANGGLVTFPFTAPTGVSQQAHYESFRYKLAEQSATIGRNTRMNAGNLIICGEYPYIILSGMKNFQQKTAISDAPQGPIIAGQLNEYQVVYDPDYPTNQWVMGYKGQNYLQSNFIYAPYMPFFTSEIVWLNFFEGHQGTGTAFGSHMVRSAGFSTGQILMS